MTEGILNYDKPRGDSGATRNNDGDARRNGGDNVTNGYSGGRGEGRGGEYTKDREVRRTMKRGGESTTRNYLLMRVKTRR